MMKEKRDRLFPVMAAIFLIIALILGVTLLLFRVPDNRQFEDAYFSAQMALTEGNRVLFKRWVLKASKYAISVAHWKSILRIVLEEVPVSSLESDYTLFALLAERASSAIPGVKDFQAYWIWGLLRSGHADKARKYTGVLNNEWMSLAAEANVQGALDDSDVDIARFIDKSGAQSDPELISRMASLTHSAELTFDAALLYMLRGDSSRAFNLAEAVLSEDRRWADESGARKRSILTALASIAFDNGQKDIALKWLEESIKDSDRRRTTSWKTLQFLGDIYWRRYLLTGTQKDLESAGEKWLDAIHLILPDSVEVAGRFDSPKSIMLNEIVPSESWRLWVNLSVQQFASGNRRASRKTLTRALVLFPDIDEVKATWIRTESDFEPAFSRRLMRDSGNGSPVLNIVKAGLDPDVLTPRLYEARLWELFNIVTSDTELYNTDRRLLTAFLLEYMRSLHNFSSIDVIIDRYLKVFPDEAWISSWRLAADASRGVALLDLMPDVIEGISPYEKFRNFAREERSWKALYDAALFTVMLSHEIRTGLLQNLYSEVAPYSPEQEARIPALEAGIMNILKSYREMPQFNNTLLEDRIKKLETNHQDIVKSTYFKELMQSGNKGEHARAEVSAVLLEKSATLLNSALEDLVWINQSGLNLNIREKTDLLYMEALLLNKTDRVDASIEKAREVVSIDPDHRRALELLKEEQK